MMFNKTPVSRHRHRDWVGIAIWISLIVTSLLWAAPFVFLFLTSVKSQADITQLTMWDLPTVWQWSNYTDAMERGRLWQTGFNSLIVSIIKVPIGLLLAAATAYALARIKPLGHRLLLAFIALGSMVPVQIGLGSLFATMLQLDLLNTRLGLILPYIAFGVPFSVFLLYGFFRAIPDEIEESARLDGASTFRIFAQIALPLAKPALAAVFIIDFVGTWNEYAMAVALISGQEMATIPLAVQTFTTQYATEYGPMNAFIIMSAIPVLIVYLMFQRYFVQGALSGAIK